MSQVSTAIVTTAIYDPLQPYLIIERKMCFLFLNAYSPEL